MQAKEVVYRELPNGRYIQDAPAPYRLVSVELAEYMERQDNVLLVAFDWLCEHDSLIWRFNAFTATLLYVLERFF